MEVTLDGKLIERCIFVHCYIINSQLSYFYFVTVKWVVFFKSEIQCLVRTCIEECVDCLRFGHFVDFLTWDEFATVEYIPVVFSLVNYHSLSIDVHPTYFVIFYNFELYFSSLASVVDQIQMSVDLLLTLG